MRSMMRVMLAQVAGGGGGGGVNGFTGILTFTVDHTQCGTADSTDFPVCVRETRAALKTTGNGGSVTNANGYDIVFCSDAGLTTPLDFEIEVYEPTTGEYVAHVRIPTLSHTTDTVFYAGYGKASITTSQENITAVWDTNYKAVYHFKRAGAELLSAPPRVTQESTSNNNDFTSLIFGGTTTAATVAGPVGDAYPSAMSAADSASLRPSTNFTIEAWVKPPNYASDRCAVAKATASVSRRNYSLFIVSGTGFLSFSVTQGGGAAINAVGTNAVSTSAFSHLVGTYDGSNLRAYLNGSLEATVALTGAVDTSASDDLAVGMYDAGGANFQLGGPVDEVRLSASVRSASWILAQYNNQKASSTFYAVT